MHGESHTSSVVFSYNMTMNDSARRQQTPSQLWTIQREGAYEVFLRSGVLRANVEHIDPDFIPAYEWMAAQLKKKSRKPQGFPARYPVWAWLQYMDRDNKSPKPYQHTLLPSGSKGVLLELALDPSMFLASDVQKWHAVLNQEYLPKDNSDQQEFDAWAEKCRQLERDPSLIESRIESSWRRVFDIDEAGSDCWEGPEQREIQAVIWQIDREMVVSAERFVAS